MYPTEREDFAWALQDLKAAHAAQLRERDATIADLKERLRVAEDFKQAQGADR